MSVDEALACLPRLIDDYRQITAELIEAKKQLTNYEQDRYVGWDWVCDYLGLEQTEAQQMLKEEKILVHDRQLQRFRRSDIIRFAERHSILVKDLDMVVDAIRLKKVTATFKQMPKGGRWPLRKPTWLDMSDAEYRELFEKQMRERLKISMDKVRDKNIAKLNSKK